MTLFIPVVLARATLRWFEASFCFSFGTRLQKFQTFWPGAARAGGKGEEKLFGTVSNDETVGWDEDLGGHIQLSPVGGRFCPALGGARVEPACSGAAGFLPSPPHRGKRLKQSASLVVRKFLRCDVWQVLMVGLLCNVTNQLGLLSAAHALEAGCTPPSPKAVSAWA